MSLPELKRTIESAARYLRLDKNMRPSFTYNILERGKYGFAYRDCWNLCDYLNTVVLGTVRRLREKHCGVPAALCGDGDVDAGDTRWNAILDEIANGIEAGIKANEDYAMPDDPRWEQHKRALALLCEYWWSLWD